MGQLAYWSDSEVIRDYARQRFPRNQQPETFLEAAYTGDNYVACLRPFPAQRLPLQFAAASPSSSSSSSPRPRTSGVVQRGSVGFVRLREDDSTIALDRSSERFDAFFGLERPTAITPWLTYTPVAGGRVTHYFRRSATRIPTPVCSASSPTCASAPTASSPSRASKQGADGLRHLIEPFAQYRYIPDAEKGRAHIPDIDRNVFSTRLQPIDLGDIRHLDDLTEFNTLRYGLAQRLQTRDGKGGVRDLVILTLAQDRHFNRLVAPALRRSSDLHADIALMPAQWLRFDAFQRLDPHHWRVEEFNAGVTLTDARKFWTARFGMQFLRDLNSRSTRSTSRTGSTSASPSPASGATTPSSRSSTSRSTACGRRSATSGPSSTRSPSTRGQRRESGFQFRLQLEVFKF